VPKRKFISQLLKSFSEELYHTPTGTGKTTAHTDTYRGRFVKLVPRELVVEVDELETDGPALRGDSSR